MTEVEEPDTTNFAWRISAYFEEDDHHPTLELSPSLSDKDIGELIPIIGEQLIEMGVIMLKQSKADLDKLTSGYSNSRGMEYGYL